MHAVWGKHKGTRSWNILVFLGSEFYGGAFGNIFSFNRHRTSDLQLSDFWRFSKFLSCLPYEVRLLCSFLRLFQIWSSKFHISCLSCCSELVSSIYVTMYHICIEFLSNNDTRYESFDFIYETSAKNCVTNIPHMMYNCQVLKICKSPTALSRKSDGGRNLKYRQKMRHKILTLKIQGCLMIFRLYTRLRQRASIRRKASRII